MEKSRVLGASIATRFEAGTTWLPSSNHLRNETRCGVLSKYLKCILFDEFQRFMSSKKVEGNGVLDQPS